LASNNFVIDELNPGFIILSVSVFFLGQELNSVLGGSQRSGGVLLVGIGKSVFFEVRSGHLLESADHCLSTGIEGVDGVVQLLDKLVESGQKLSNHALVGNNVIFRGEFHEFQTQSGESLIDRLNIHQSVMGCDTS